MKTETLHTYYAPAERTSMNTLERQVNELSRERFLRTVTDAVPSFVLVLNAERQTIFTNKQLIKFLNIGDAKTVEGKRPGELFGCLHADETAGGCGTTKFCRECGAVNAILASQKGKPAVDECRILTKNNNALDFRVWANPFKQNGEMLTIFAALDISDEKRRQTLERIFFHDILNTAGVVSGFSDVLMEEEDPDEMATIAGFLCNASQRLIEEIQSQRLLSSAERGDLALNPSEIDTSDILSEVANTYAGHEVAKDRNITIARDTASCHVTTDTKLLIRVLGNMVKNALEATPPGGDIVLACSAQQHAATFSVKNHSTMPPEVQLQVFKRSFSTKGKGRGIGTFSIKLLGENYLNGSVWFESSQSEGTTFFLTIPTRL